MQEALADPAIVLSLHRANAVDVLAVGKAASAMLAAFTATAPVPLRTAVAVSVHDAGHPVPDARSVAAAEMVLQTARSAHERDLLVVLLSGGASALMALPAEGLSLDDKQRTVRLLLAAGADIGELNTVRKHLSAIKGGRLALACAGSTLTLAISDVVGDDLSVIGSGPTVADPATWSDALAVLDRRGGRAAYPETAVAILEAGERGALGESPKPGDPRLSRSSARIIGGRAEAIAGARQAARSRGYSVHVIEEPVVGEARVAGSAHVETIGRLLKMLPRPACVISGGETTVHVVGGGKGGRNQEFALAMARQLASLGPSVAAVSAGTDGIDGPTDAAGAIVDHTTLARADAAGLAPDRYLNDNDSYAFFQALNDLVRTGPTNTNVGDLQVVLVGE